jgi:hypothetical protein
MPATLEPPLPVTDSQDRQRHFRHRFLISAIRFTVVLALSAGIGGGWYLARKGFGRQWRHRVVEELHKRGVEVSIRRLTLDPFRGLVAQDVRIFDYKNRQSGTNRENALAIISQIALDVNYGALIHHQPFLNAVDVQNARITLPGRNGDNKNPKPILTNLRAHIYFPPEQIDVSQAEGIFCGIRVSATGQLIKRENYKPKPGELSAEALRKRFSNFEKVITELRQFSAPGKLPSLQVKFTGDLAQMENSHVEATLQGERLRRGQYEMREIFAEAEWRDQILNVRRWEWNDAAGNFAARGTWDRRQQTAHFQARSTLDLKTLLDAFGLGKRLADIRFVSAPIIELAGDVDLGGSRPRVKAIGHADVAQLTYKDLPFSDCGLEFSWDGERTFLRDIHARQNSGGLRAEILDAPDDFRLNIDSNISPIILRPFVSPELNEFLNDWEFPRTAAVRFAIRGRDRHPENWQGDGTLALERARFRGAWMNSATAKVHFANGAVTYDNMRIVRDEGVGTGTFTYDFANHEVRVSNIKSSLRPSEAILWIDPKLLKTVTPYKFHQPPNITANGVYQFRGGKNTRLEVNVESQGGMDYVFLDRTLPFERVSAKLVFTNDRLQILDLNGPLFSGKVRGHADISLAQNNSRYQANLAVNGINFPRLTALYFGYKTAQGELNGTYAFDGFSTDARKMSGTGKIEVSNGDVFAIPVFGPISGILGSLLPGSVGYSVARKATASFKVKNGIIHTDDFEVAGNLFSMPGHGDIYFLDDKLDFDVRVQPKGASVLLTPVYKLFEYKGEGSLKNPDWHAKGF